VIVTVVGARGGVGTTSLAVALARGLGAVVVDTDGPAGGIDLWLGGEEAAGVRWSGLGLAGGELPAAELLAALPRIDRQRVLAADRAELPTPDSVGQVLEILAGADVVVDLARRVDAVAAEVVARSDLVLVVVPGGVAGSASAHVVVQTLSAFGPTVPFGVVVTGRSVAPAVTAAAIGAPVLASAATPADLEWAAAGLVDGLRAAPP
jgi:cellulose biosynthesis protein BcsQ